MNKRNEWLGIIIGFMGVAGGLVTVVASSVLFGVFHLLSGNILQLVITGLIGALFCFLRLKLKHCSTLSLVIGHGIYDALITVWVYVFA